MEVIFDSFEDWKLHCVQNNIPFFQPVLDYERNLVGTSVTEIKSKMLSRFQVMKEAVQIGLSSDMKSKSGMVNNGAKKVANSSVHTLNSDFTFLISNTLAAKEMNACMGRIVAAPTAGASGILPGALVTLQTRHSISDDTMVEALLIASGIGMIIQRKASVSGAVGGCQAETGSAAAMAAGAIVYALNGNINQILTATAIAIQCTLGLICDPVAGLVEVPCIVRNASAVSIAYTAAQIAISDVNAVIPVDECVAAMAEVGKSMESRYKETAKGGLANTNTAKEIEKNVFGKNL